MAKLPAEQNAPRRARHQDGDDSGTPKWAYAVAIASGLILVLVMLGVALLVKRPTAFQAFVFRVVTALAAAGFGAAIPGFMRLRLPLWRRGALHAGGALGLFVLVYMVNPPGMVSETPEEVRTGLQNVSHEVQQQGEQTRKALGVIPEEERLREFDKVRRSYLLGFRLALAVVVQARNLEPESDAREYIDQLLGKAQADASHLSLPGAVRLRPIQTGDDQTQYVIRQVPLGNSLAAAIEKKHGSEAHAAFDLAFKVGIAPLYVGALDQAKQEDVFDGYKQNLRVLDLPETSLSILQTGFAGADEAERVGAVFDFKKLVLRSLFKRVSNTVWSRQAELDIWQFTSQASTIAAGYSTGKIKLEDLSDIKTQVDTAGNRLGLIMPELPPLTGDNIKDTAAILHYLLQSLGNGLVDDIEERFGPNAVAIHELGTKLSCLVLLYSAEPGMDLNAASISAITRTCQAVEMPEDLWKPLVRQVQRGENYDTVKTEIFRFKERFTQHLKWRVQRV